MKKRTMINHYRRHSVADAYIIGFVENHELYMAQVDEIMPRFLSVEAASRNQGDNLRLRIKKQYKAYFIKHGAIHMGNESLLFGDKYNKGELFEKAVTEKFGLVWEKNNIPFWVQGDIQVNGAEIQIKLDGATLLNTKQIEKNFYKRAKRG